MTQVVGPGEPAGEGVSVAGGVPSGVVESPWRDPEARVRGVFVRSLPSRRFVVAGLWASAVAAALIALGELDSLVGQVPADGRVFSLTGLTGPAAAASWSATAQEWRTLADLVAQGGGPSRWVAAYAAVDVVLIALYSFGATAVLRRARETAGPTAPLFTLALGLLATGAGADLVESLALLLLASGRVLAPLLVAASAVKWVCLVLAVVVVVLAGRHARDHPRGRSAPTPYTFGDLVKPPGAVGRVLRGLYTHRFSLLVVVPFAVLGLAKGSDILDQLPDVQRQWVDDDPVAHIGGSTLLTVLVAVVVLVIGRLRSHHVAMRVLARAAPYTAPDLLPWLVAASIIAVGAAVSALLLGGWDVIEARFWPALAVPFLVWFASFLWRRRAATAPWGPYRRPVSPAQARTTTVVGDALGVLVVVIPGLGLVRAFTAPVALRGDPTEWALLGCGLVGAVLTWPAAMYLARLFSRRGPLDWLVALTPGRILDEAGSGRARTFGWGLLVAGVALFLSIGLWPHWFLEEFGVIELILLAVTGVALPLGATVVLLQAGGAPDVLSRPRTTVLRTAPVMTLIVLTALLVGLSGSDERVHGLRTTGSAPFPDRPTLADGIAARVADGDCATTLSDASGADTGHTVRPVFLLAAEGGGIRAAAWTALGTDALHEAGGRCARALVSSGASGGAVGLTVSGFAAKPGEAFDAVRAMAGPDALGVAVSGLLVRDPVRSVTGIPFPTEGESGWVDRAGLMEREWEKVEAGLTVPFLAGPADRVTGPLVLNSTSVATRCRTLLSQVALEPRPSARDCQSPTSPPDSVDLLPTLRTSCSGDRPNLRASTVALLASRFPYVTPSAVVTSECPRDGGLVSQQVVDGGYADNDGLGTVIDLTGQWLPALTAHNGAVLADPGSAPLLVPVLVYLDNGPGSDIAARSAGATNELLVPLLTKSAATAGLSSTDSQLHRALDTFSVERVVPGCAAAVCQAVDRWRGPAVKVFYQPTQPSIAAPLGWVLSQHSLDTLTCARDEQVSPAGLADVSGPGACPQTASMSDEPPAAPVDRCAAVGARDDSPLLTRKGYGTMWSALCLAEEAAAAR